MGYNGLTNLGVEYLARMIAENKPVTFTKIKVGNGSIPGSQTGASTTNLYSFKKDVEILSKNQIENSIKLQVLLNNLDLEAGFYVKELGVYVQDGEQEKLYWYINKDNPSYLPDKNTPSTHRYNLFLEVSNLETNIINFTGEGLLADKKFVEDSIEEAFNNFEEGYNATINTLLPKGNIPNSLNSAEKIVAALQGNGGLKFDENLLYLNDEGTKEKGLYYLDRLAEGIFECLEQTDEKVNNSAKFKNISNKENSDRLDNLFEIEKKSNSVLYIKPSTTRTYRLKKHVYGKLTAIIILFHETHDVQDLYFINSYDRTDGFGYVHARTILAPAGNKVTADGETFTITAISTGVFAVFLTPKIYDGTIDFMEYFEDITDL